MSNNELQVPPIKQCLKCQMYMKKVGMKYLNLMNFNPSVISTKRVGAAFDNKD